MSKVFSIERKFCAMIERQCSECLHNSLEFLHAKNILYDNNFRETQHDFSERLQVKRVATPSAMNVRGQRVMVAGERHEVAQQRQRRILIQGKCLDRPLDDLEAITGIIGAQGLATPF